MNFNTQYMDPITREALDRLIERGLVKQSNEGYCITEAGTEALNRELERQQQQPNLPTTISDRKVS